MKILLSGYSDRHLPPATVALKYPTLLFEIYFFKEAGLFYRSSKQDDQKVHVVVLYGKYTVFLIYTCYQLAKSIQSRGANGIL